MSDVSPTQDASLDTFDLRYLLPPVAILALIFNYEFKFVEIAWSFSIWLESVAILPQLFMLQRTGQADTITTHYIAALGLYRALYIPNWLYRCVYLQLHPPQPSNALTPDTLPRAPSSPLPSSPASSRPPSTPTLAISTSQRSSAAKNSSSLHDGSTVLHVIH